jgi:chromate transporter
MPDAALSRSPASDRPIPGLIELFLGFLTIALTAFGGALPLARRILVERRGWLDDAEFTEMLSLCQFLPGPNIGNLSIATGARFRGVAGAAAAFLGLTLVPFLLMIACGALYDRYGAVGPFRHAFAGIAAVAAGLIIAMVAKLAHPVLRRAPRHGILIILMGFVAVGCLRWPLLAVLAVLAPLSMLSVPGRSG